MKLFIHFKKALQAYKRNFIPIALVLLLFLSIYFSIFFALYLVTPTFLMVKKIQSTGNISEEEFNKSLQAYQPIGLILILFFIAIVVASVLLQAGFWGLCMKGIKRKVSMGTFFGAIKEHGFSYFLATILVLLIFFGLGIFCLALFAIFFSISSIFALIMSFIEKVILLSLIDQIFTLSGFILGKFIYFHFICKNLIFCYPLFLYIIVYFLATLLLMPFFIFVPSAIISGRGVFDSLVQSFSFGKRKYFELLLLILILSLFILISLIPVVGVALFYFLIIPLGSLTICSYYSEISEKKRRK